MEEHRSADACRHTRVSTDAAKLAKVGMHVQGL